MKQKLSLLLFASFGLLSARANIGDPGNGTSKKDELNGVVVHAETKKPLKDVSITAILVSKKEKTTATDDDGNFNFDQLKPGTYKFIFEKSGYRKVTKEKIIIKTDEAFQMNIEMMEAEEYDIMPSPFSMGMG
ncbi:MAG TPA: carboxypeptidase-like regulatory domain-containing protein [Chitinophagaceae bacterium]|jgi:5-hydroxyisourate hydrolase-like protein (transthyretin family)|nr:carboxypeptidase-like regulatory domain-containing protein [Chitinophagaceae bacterium]